MVGSYNVWESGYTGAGMRIAIIDTGLDVDHPSFDADAYLYALEEQAEKEGKTIADYDLLDQEDIDAVFDYLNAVYFVQGDTSSDALYLNEKVPFAFNYVDATDAYVTHDYDTKGDHGTHVAGIAAANKYVPTEEGYETQENDVSGVAPNAQLMVMKVFGKNGGAYTDDYMAAIQDALLLGADSINLSLGSGNPGESSEYEASEAYVNYIMDSLAETDTVVAFSAGNSGMWAEESVLGGLLPIDVMMQTNGSPGSYRNSFTVASAENTGMTGYIFDAEGVKVVYTESTGYGNAPFASLDETGEGSEYEYVFVPGYGAESDYDGLDVEGKVVFVTRGGNYFYEKYNFAAERGAAAVVIYNNTTGTIGLNLTGIEYTIPGVSIMKDEADAIRELSTAETVTTSQGETVEVYTGTMNVYSTATTIKDYYENAIMSDFSSWGVPGDLTLKPEITAPGGNIWSTIDDGNYGVMSGTSMASPSVAGLSALVLEYIEKNQLAEKTGLSARELALSLLMSTATPLTQDETYYSPRKQGAGLANVSAATTTPVYITMREDGKVKAELGDDPERTGVYEISFTLHNMSDETQYYVIDTTALTEELVEGLIVGDSYQLDPTVTFTGTSYSFDIDRDGDVDLDDALTLLRVVNESEENEFISANEALFDLNQNGVLDTTDVHLYLQLLEEGYMGDALVSVEDEADVSVTITLSDEDRTYLDENFVNGMFVDGFVTLDGSVDLGIPFLAFYGNWADASMFEHVNYLDLDNSFSYSNTYATNAFVDGEDYVLGGNNYADDEEYLEERNAMTSDTLVGGVYYTLIRNAAKVIMQVSDQETNEVYFSKEVGYRDAEFYYVNGGSWQNTQIYDEIGWDVTDLDGNPLPEGTKVNISVVALPAYYEDSTTIPGAGCTFTLPITIDDTAPVVSDIVRNEDGTLSVTATDENYIAAIQVYNRDGELVGIQAVNQTERGVQTTTTVEVDEEVLDSRVVYVSVIDYAGNVTTVRKNFTSVEDTDVATGLIITWYGEDVTGTTIELFEGRSVELQGYVYPETILDDSVAWNSDNESVSVENGLVTGLKAGETATITATSKALNAEGQPLTATVTIKVNKFNTKLTGIHNYDEGMTFSLDYFESANPKAYNTVLKLPTLADGAELISATDYFNYLITADDKGNIYLNNSSSPMDNTKDYFGVALPLTDLTYGPATGNLYATYGPYLVWINYYDDSYGAINLANYFESYLNGITFVGYDVAEGEICEVLAITTTDGAIYYLYQSIYENEPWIYDLGRESDGSENSLAYNSLYYDYENDILVNAVYDGYWRGGGELSGEFIYYTDFYAYDLLTGKTSLVSQSSNLNLYYGLIDPTFFGIVDETEAIRFEKSMLQVPTQVTFNGFKTNPTRINYTGTEKIIPIDLKLDKGGNQ
ncbi:MAG: S8 family serine peptidase [Traorella sp.]